jgi:hypothetical protein
MLKWRRNQNSESGSVCVRVGELTGSFSDGNEMLMKKTISFAAGLALVALLTSTASAQEVFTWVQGTSGALDATATSSGTITYDTATGTIESYSFDLSTASLAIEDNALGAWSTIIVDGYQAPMDAYVGTTTILPDGNLQFLSVTSALYPANMSSVSSLPSYTTTQDSAWIPTAGASSGANENSFLPSGRSALTGDWVPVVVPEPATISLLVTGLLGALTIRRRKV